MKTLRTALFVLVAFLGLWAGCYFYWAYPYPHWANFPVVTTGYVFGLGGLLLALYNHIEK